MRNGPNLTVNVAVEIHVDGKINKAGQYNAHNLINKRVEVVVQGLVL